METESIVEALSAMTCNAGWELRASMSGGNARALVSGPGIMMYRDAPIAADAVLSLYTALLRAGELDNPHAS